MRWTLLLLLCATALGCDSGGGGGGPAAAPAQSASCGDGSCEPPSGPVYVLGSSYSWDALPAALDEDPEWQIYCAKTLDYIYRNPDAHCVASSTPWPEVLDPPAEEWAYVSFQPVKGPDSTLERDIAYISEWLAGQPPSTVGVIHATWPTPDSWEAVFHAPAPDPSLTNYSLEYGYTLLEELERTNPGRRFVLTRSNEMLDYIRHDPNAPFRFEDLFRDSGGHMSLELGRYLQHNAMRQAMRQETGVDSTVQGVPDFLRNYLDEVVALHPAHSPTN